MKNGPKKFWKWWLVFNLGVLALIVGHVKFDLYSLLLAMDSTYLTFGILAIAILTSASLFTMKTKDWQWFSSDAVLSLGMVGTLFGFLLVLGQTFSDIDTSSTESMSAAIGTLAQGMSTALITSLVGLVSSLWVKLQLVIVEED
jgi:uncharacterized membrane protein HdeD (DUF308 family)